MCHSRTLAQDTALTHEGHGSCDAVAAALIPDAGSADKEGVPNRTRLRWPLWEPDFGYFDRVRNVMVLNTVVSLVGTVLALAEGKWVLAGIAAFLAYLTVRVRPHLKTSEQARQRYEAKQARKARR